jgi:hypothetical protein
MSHQRILRSTCTFILALGMAGIGCKSPSNPVIITLDIEDTVFSKTKLDETIQVLSKRLELQGLENAGVSLDKSGRQLNIKTEKPDTVWLKNYLLKKGTLFFYETYSLTELISSLNGGDAAVFEKIAKGQDTSAHPLLKLFMDFARPYGSKQLPGYIGLVSEENIPKLKVYMALAMDYFPADAMMLMKPTKYETFVQDIYEIYFLKNNDTKFFAAGHIKEAVAKNEGKNYKLQMHFDPYAAKMFGKITGANLNKAIAIVSDGKILTAPAVMSAITNGNIEISADFKKEEAKNLAAMLQSGYLPLKLSLRQIAAAKNSM